MSVTRIDDHLGAGHRAGVLLTPVGVADLVAEGDETVGFGKREWAQENSVDDGEDGGGRADAKGQHEHGRCRESGRGSS